MIARVRSLLFLIGYRGTGKTTVARLLAPRLGWDWLDADQTLEERHGRTIRQIFAEEGEASFRDKEAAVLEEVCTRERIVVATGGGVILREDNRFRLKRGYVVWLRADAETLWQRLQQDAATAQRRPNLAQGGLEEIAQLLSRRAPLYAKCADLVVDADRSPEEVAANIFECVKDLTPLNEKEMRENKLFIDNALSEPDA